MAAASDTDVQVGNCGVGKERVGTDMVGRLGVWMVGVATVAVEEIDITAATLWPLLLLLGLGGVGVPEVVGTKGYSRCHSNDAVTI